MVDIVFYYPSRYGAPSEVARCLFSVLINRSNHIDIGVFPQSNKEVLELKEKFDDISIISARDMLNSFKKAPVHFPMSPFLFPNRKFLLYLMSRIKQNKLIMNYHGEPRSEFRLNLANNDFLTLLGLPNYVMVPYILKSADLLILNSGIMKNLFVSSYKSNNIRVIPNGIDISWFKSRKEDFSMKLNEIKELSIFYHGRLAPEKGVDILLKAFSIALKEYEESKSSVILYIAGDGPQGKYLKKLAFDLEINKNVVFLGKIPLSDLRYYLRSVDAGVYPSRYEPFSLAVLEAFSSVNGPVMYSNYCGINDFVKQDGYKFHTFEPTLEGTTRAIKCILNRTYDNTIHYKQKEFASRYTWNKIAQQYVELYLEFIGEK